MTQSSSGPFQFPHVRVVQASAGSGKTYALAKRYVQLLLLTADQAPLGIKHILAITFTNKAAVEMKSRIIDLLKRLALGRLPPDQQADICGPLGLDDARSARLAAALMEDVIRHYHFFGVQTIDSFMNALLAGCAFKINLSARFKIRRDARDYVQLSLDELIAEAGSRKDVRALFDVFIRQYLFLENRSGWFPKKDLLAVLFVLFNQFTTYQVPFVTFAVDGKGVGELKRRFLNVLAEMDTVLPEGTDKRFKDGLEKFIAAHPAGFDIDDVSKYFTRPQVPLRAGTDADDRLDRLWEESRRLLRGICLQEAYGVFNPYIELFNAVLTHFDRLQTKEDVLFLQQLNQKAGQLFDDGLVSVEELYFRLATRFRHYLVDEFQDTSLSQWRNLQLMVEEALSTGGTLFYVGDKKQAIYGFRGGHSGLFDSIQEQFRHFNVIHELLENNYRSQSTIVAFNNRLFDLDHLRVFMRAVEAQDRWRERDIAFGPEDWERLAHTFAGARQIPRADRPHGAVRVQIIPGKKKEERDALTRQKVIAIIRDAHTRFTYGEIAVLTRNNAEVQMVTEWLIAEDIYAQSERTSDVKNHPLICDIMAFLRFLSSPVDNDAFAEFLLGDLFPAVTGLSKLEIQAFLFSCRQQKAGREDVYFYKRFRDAYPGIWQEYIDVFFNRVGVFPIYELAVSICGTWRCVQAFPEAQGFVMHFLELVKRQEEESCDLDRFLEYFEGLENEDRFVPSPSQDAVHVLTVHKAKGLEFPVVVVPFLEMTIKAGASGRESGQSFTWEIEEEGMRLVRLKESYTLFSEELRERYMAEYKASFFSELNNIYVALTRPVWELHALVPERVGNSVNPLPLFIPEDMHQCGEFAVPSRHQQVTPARDFLPAVEYRQWVTQLQEEFVPEPEAQVLARQEGEVIHYALSLLGNLTGADVTRAVEDAAAAAARRFRGKPDPHALAARLNGLIQRPEWRPFFFLPEDAGVLREQEIVDQNGDVRRIDRLIVRPDRIDVIDFKTSAADAARHEAQMAQYAALAARLYPGRAIEAKLLYVYE